LWDYIITIFNQYGLIASLAILLGAGLLWLGYQIYKESLNYKEREQNERFSQTREMNSHIRAQQDASVTAINAVHETLISLLAKVDLLEREIHENVGNDNSQNLSLSSLVSELPKHAQDCSTANSKVLEELHKIHLEIVACKTILESR